MLARTRVSSLAVDVVVASGLALVVGLFRLGTPSFLMDESLTALEIQWSYDRALDGYYWLYYSIEKLGRLRRLVGGSSPLPVRARDDARLCAARRARAQAVRPARRARRRRAARAQPVRRQVVAGARVHAPPRGQRARDPAPAARSSAARASVGAVRARVLGGDHLAPAGGVILAPAHILLVSQRRERVLPHGLAAALVIMALGVPWAAQIAIRSTEEGVAMDWLTFPTPEVAAHSLLDVSGAGGLGLLLALVGLWAAAPCRRPRSGLLAATWAFTPFVVALLISVARPIFLDRYLIVASPAFALLGAVAILGVGACTGGARSRPSRPSASASGSGTRRTRATGAGRTGGARPHGARAAGRGRRGCRRPPAARRAEYYGARPVDVSTAGSLWVLVWSETKPRDVEEAERRALGFGDHVRVEKLQFGRRLSAQPGDGSPD